MDSTCSASAAPAGLTVQVCFPGARAVVLDNLNRQREEGRLCDLSIQVQGQVFRAHRCVLAASSPYFHDQVGIGPLMCSIHNRVSKGWLIFLCRCIKRTYLLTGVTKECHNGLFALSYGPLGLWECPEFCLHRPAEHCTWWYCELRHCGKFPSDVAHCGQMHWDLEEAPAPSRSNPRRGHCSSPGHRISAAVPKQHRLLVPGKGGKAEGEEAWCLASFSYMETPTAIS